MGYDNVHYLYRSIGHFPVTDASVVSVGIRNQVMEESEL